MTVFEHFPDVGLYIFQISRFIQLSSFDFWYREQGEVYIRGRKRVGLIDDEELSGIRIGLVRIFSNLVYI